MLRRAAIAVAVTHAAIGAVGAIVIAKGTPAGGPLDERMAYVAGCDAWLLAWLVPCVAAAALLWLAAELRARLAPSPRLDLAVAATAVGAAIEGVCCLVAGAAMPALDATTFVAVERAVQLGTGTVGNAWFTVAQLLFTLALARAGAGRAVVGLGVATTVAGVVYAIAGPLSAQTVPVASGLLLLCLTGYAVALARWARIPA